MTLIQSLGFQVQESDVIVSNLQEEERELGYREILSSRRVKFLLLGIFTSMFTYIFLDPVLAPFMDYYYGVEPELVGFVFLGMGAGYILYCAVLPWLSERVARRTLIHVGTLLYSGAIFFIGPSMLLGLPKSLALSVVALVLHGVFGAYLVLLYAEVVDVAKEHAGSDSKQLNDLVSGLQNAFVALGQLTGPLVGNYLTQEFSFFTACDLMGFWALIYTAVHWICCDCLYVKPTRLGEKLKKSS